MDASSEPSFRDLYLVGKITREAYWSEISKTLMGMSNLKGLFANSDIVLEFSAENPRMSFPISSLHSSQIMTLEIDFAEVREAPFQVLAEGQYEHFLSTVFFTICSISKYLFDVGANVGYHTIGALAFNPEFKCTAFEPNESVATKFRRNLVMNGHFNDVDFFDCALGLSSEKGLLKVPTLNGSPGSTLTDSYQGDYLKVDEVEIHALDDFLSSRCDLLKIDVEGYEFNVISGGIGFIQKNLPIIFIELMRKWMRSVGHHPNQVLDTLFSLGYECFAISDTSLIQTTNVNDNTLETNFLFVHSNDSRKSFFAHLVS